MIVFVNIGKSLEEGKSFEEAPKRKWKLKLERCKECDFVIGVAQGQAKCFFILNDVYPDLEDPSRVAFELGPCIQEDIENLMKIIEYNDVNLKGIQRGKYLLPPSESGILA